MFDVRRILSTLIDILLPRRARLVRTEARTLEDIPLTPISHDLLGVRITTLMNYQDAAVEDLIRSLKYDGSTHAAALAAALLTDYLDEEIAAARVFGTREVYIVPVPLHKKRVRERGWNQIELVVNALPAEYKNGVRAQLALKVLSRTRATQPQTRLSRSERLSNVAGAFSLESASSLKGARIFLIDDVTTTGATLANSATPLRRAGAAVSLIALARA